MKAVILAAGYATRLYPLTKDKPKCLLTVGGKTILDQICEKIAAIPEIDEILIVTNARFYEQMEAWRKTAPRKPSVRILNDGTTSNDNRLGAIGDLQFTIKQCRVDADVLMMASDNLFDQDLRAFMKSAHSREDAVSIAVYDIKDPMLASKKFGVIEISSSGEVTQIEEKPEFPKSSFIGMGVYYFPKSTLPLVDTYLGQKDAADAPGFYIRWLVGRVKIFAFTFSGMWYDIGDLKALEEANSIYNQKN